MRLLHDWKEIGPLLKTRVFAMPPMPRLTPSLIGNVKTPLIPSRIGNVKTSLIPSRIGDPHLLPPRIDSVKPRCLIGLRRRFKDSSKLVAIYSSNGSRGGIQVGGVVLLVEDNPEPSARAFWP